MLQISDLFDDFVRAALHVAVQFPEEELGAARLYVREAANQVVLHLDDAHHYVLHVLPVVFLREVEGCYAFCQQFSAQVVDVFFQVFAFHLTYNIKVCV